VTKISRTRGKQFELAIAKRLGCKRNHFEKEDLKHGLLSIECKHREKLPTTVMKWITQAEEAATENKIPIVVAHQRQQKYEDSLVIMRLSSLEELLDRLDILSVSKTYK
jgi:hypothetical protein